MVQVQMAQSPAPGRVLYSRYNDGARPVRVLPDGWEILGGGQPAKYTTAQALLAELTGHPTGRHWSLDRYFGIGDYAPAEDRRIGQANVLDLFKPKTKSITLLEPLAPLLLAFRSNTPDTAISVPFENQQESTRNTKNRVSRAPNSRRVHSELFILGPVGIDLVHRAEEVRKLLFAGFGRRMYAAGYDPEDVLQEVYKGLLARNQGKCPWDPAKSSFGHYVYMVCGCVLSNYHRKQSRMKQFEQSGLPSYEDGTYAYRDAASSTTHPAPETAEQAGSLLNEAADDLVDYMLDMPRGASNEAHLAIKVLPYVAAGTSRTDIAAALDVSAAAVSRAISFLRKTARAWQQSRLH